MDEALRRFEERRVEGGLSGGMDGLGLSEVDLVGCHQPDAGVMVFLVIPREESAAEAAGMLDGLEVLWKFRLVFQGLEVCFRERVIV